jgi:hypothetical protein
MFESGFGAPSNITVDRGSLQLAGRAMFCKASEPKHTGAKSHSLLSMRFSHEQAV